MIREFDEELRGRSEEYGSEAGPVDYDSWPFARHMADALDRGQIRAWCLGLGTDPLTYATDLLTVVVIDSGVFDELFSLSPRRNAEGSVLAAREFDAHVIDRMVTSEPGRRPAPPSCGWRGGTAGRSSASPVLAHRAGHLGEDECLAICWASMRRALNVPRQMEKQWLGLNT